ILERHVQRAAIRWLRDQSDCHCERINVFTHRDGRRRYRSADVGSPDLHATVRGRVLYVECKAPGGQQRPSQRQYQARVEARGCKYIVEDSLKLETLRAAVAELRGLP